MNEPDAATEQDKWQPVRRGDVYCSPRCGFECTWAAYERAVREAAQLCAVLGNGWEPEVWENWGWHWAAGKGVARVLPSITGSAFAGTYTVDGYTVYFNSAHQVAVNAKTPEDALGLAIQDARTIAQRIFDDCTALSE